VNDFASNRRRSIRATLAVAFVLVLGGCASTVRIGDLLAEPQRYAGRTIQVQGTVTRSAGILGIGGYEVDDGTGQIFVVAQGTGVPAQGSRTRTKGKFEPIFNFGGRNIAAILQESQRSRDE
jgi:hypothetical protein